MSSKFQNKNVKILKDDTKNVKEQQPLVLTTCSQKSLNPMDRWPG